MEAKAVPTSPERFLLEIRLIVILLVQMMLLLKGITTFGLILLL
nr:MAG TPA: hypothetical protein [Caudoviricetes sp.]